MKLIEVTDQQAWESFQAAQPYSQFQQSWAWGEFRQSAGRQVRRFSLADDSGEWSCAVQLERRQKRFGLGYWFAQRGPVFAHDVTGDARRVAMHELVSELLKDKDLRRNSLFWRFEPASTLSEPEGLVPLSFRRSGAQSPSSTIVTDLTRSPEEMLKAMHEKTRYNIRVAERFGVKVRVTSTDQDLGRFLDLMDETAARDGFVQHSRPYLEATYRHLHSSNMARLRLAEFEGVILAANMEIAYGDTVTYLYGASSNENRNVMAPYALHWHAMREAKATGFKLYDFWGANPESKAMYYHKPSWDGLTRFKRGWGGRTLDLVGTWDLPFNVYLYRLLFMGRFFRG